MAYTGRGGLTRNNNDDNIKENRERDYFVGGLFLRRYYIPLDNTYVIFQMITTFIIFIVAGIAFLVKYKSPITDPIEDIKNTIMNTHIIIIFALIVITILINYFSKDKYALIKRLLAILAISIIVFVTFICIKINMNSKYTYSKFEQIYEETYKTEENDNKKIIDIGITSVKMKSEEQFFIDECVKLYNIFNIKTYGIIILNALLLALLMYQTSKVLKIQEKKDRLSKDDAILFDEEQNMKF